MKKQTCTKLTSAIVTLVLVAILLSKIEVIDIVDTLTGIEPMYLVAGFGLYVLIYFFRASSGEGLASEFNRKVQENT